MAGNGGQMAKKFGATKQETEAGNEQVVAEPRKSKGLKPKGKLRGGSGSKAGNKKSNSRNEKLGQPELTHQQVKEQLQLEANAILGERFKALALGMMVKACTGDVRCAELLFKLAAPTHESMQAAKEARLRELIEAMDNEPEWDSAMEEAAKALACGEPAAPEQGCGGVA